MAEETLVEVLARARRELAAGAPLDVEAWAAAHPTCAGELRRLLPALAAAVDAVRVEAAVQRGRQQAIALFQAAFETAPAAAPGAAPAGGQAAAGTASAQAGAAPGAQGAVPGAAADEPAPGAPGDTLGSLVARIEATASPGVLAEVEQVGLPRQALAQLRADATPLARLQDLGVVRALASRLGVPFRDLKVALSKLAALDRFLRADGPALAYTRGEEASAGEREALLRRVREDAQGGPAGPDSADRP